MRPHEFEINLTNVYQLVHSPPQSSFIMPTFIEQHLKLSNEHLSEWLPLVDLVDGSQYIKLDCRDRSCFRFFTGKALTFGSKYENSKYLLDFWVYLVKARSDASQAAFEVMQKELQENPDGRKRKKIRRARMEDSETVDRVVRVFVEHNGQEHMLKALFGNKKSDLWVEATVANLDFITDAMTYDYNNGNFAATRPRGPHFRRQSGDDGDDDEVEDEQRVGDDNQDDGSADN